MSDEEECIHGLGPTSACTVCNGRDRREKASEVSRPITFPAEYSGRCQECDLPIEIGEVVAWKPGKRATHEECWSEDSE